MVCGGLSAVAALLGARRPAGGIEVRMGGSGPPASPSQWAAAPARPVNRARVPRVLHSAAEVLLGGMARHACRTSVVGGISWADGSLRSLILPLEHARETVLSSS